jgi:hypothetical protein
MQAIVRFQNYARNTQLGEDPRHVKRGGHVRVYVWVRACACLCMSACCVLLGIWTSKKRALGCTQVPSHTHTHTHTHNIVLV